VEIIAGAALLLGKGFAEALGTKLEEKKMQTFQEQSCNNFACPEPSQPLPLTLKERKLKKGK
jgi:hypothetical protein